MGLEIYKEVVVRYLRMGAGQFLCDFRKEYKLQKTLAHRKSVLQKKEKASMKKLKVPIPHIESDTSKDKKVSHLRLRALVALLNANGLQTLYNKKELQKLCDAYNVRYISTWNKSKLAHDLADAILTNEVIPAPFVLSLYRCGLVAVEENRVPIVRISRLFNQ